MQNNNTASHALSKVPAVTAAFWLTKIAATALGETGGDAVAMSMMSAPSRCRTSTFAAASSGGTE